MTLRRAAVPGDTIPVKYGTRIARHSTEWCTHQSNPVRRISLTGVRRIPLTGVRWPLPGRVLVYGVHHGCRAARIDPRRDPVCPLAPRPPWEVHHVCGYFYESTCSSEDSTHSRSPISSLSPISPRSLSLSASHCSFLQPRPRYRLLPSSSCRSLKPSCQTSCRCTPASRTRRCFARRFSRAGCPPSASSAPSGSCPRNESPRPSCPRPTRPS